MARLEQLTVRQAAKVLGISERAVRMRISRKTIQSANIDGMRYVMLDTSRLDVTGGTVTRDVTTIQGPTDRELEILERAHQAEINLRDDRINYLSQRLEELEQTVQQFQRRLEQPRAEESKTSSMTPAELVVITLGMGATLVIVYWIINAI